MENGDKREAIHSDAYLSGVCWFVGSLWLSGLSGVCWFRFLPSIKKFFNFPKFFSNYLIFNAFQIEQNLNNIRA